jgi:CDP-4-dehydro-6-deoxyglucose reductase
VIHGAHQAKALSADEEAAGYVLTCCATPQTDCVLEARSVPGAGAFPVLKMPVRVSQLERAARRRDACCACSCRPTRTFQYHAGQYIEFILRDGARRSYSMANAPHTLTARRRRLHIRHMPGGKFTDHVFGAMKEKDILRVEGPFGSFFLREDSDQAHRAAGLGHRLCADQGLIEHMQFRASPAPPRCTGAAAARRTCTCTTGCRGQLRRLPHLRYVPVLSDALPEDGWTGRTGFVHQAVLEDCPTCRATRSTPAAHRSFADAFTSEADKH